MRRVYSDAWTSGDVAVGSKVLREGVVNYRLGEFAKETSGASLYAKEIMNGYAQLASLRFSSLLSSYNVFDCFS